MTVWAKMLLNGSNLEKAKSTNAWRWPVTTHSHTNKHRAGHNFKNQSYSHTPMCFGAWEITPQTNNPTHTHKQKLIDCEYFIPQTQLRLAARELTRQVQLYLLSWLPSATKLRALPSRQVSLTLVRFFFSFSFSFAPGHFLAPFSSEVWEWIWNHANLKLGLTLAHLPNVENWDL